MMALASFFCSAGILPAVAGASCPRKWRRGAAPPRPARGRRPPATTAAGTAALLGLRVFSTMGITFDVFCQKTSAFFLLALCTLTLAGCSGSSSTASVPTQPGNPVGANLTQISSDPFTIAPGQHATEVEPHMFANGSTFVAAFQAGRIPAGGATAIGWATSTDGGTSWSRGFLPGLTKGEGSGPYDAASDPAVAYDAKHGIWMIATLPLSRTLATPAVAVSRSSDGLTWENPVSADPSGTNSDKNWIVCDSWASSPHYGNCYLEWDDSLNHDEILMSTSTDGGITWGAATPTANLAQGIGGQPLGQPNGTVVVPIETSEMSAFSSSDGGLSWAAPVTISNIQLHADAGGIRSGALPSAAVDGAGRVWTVGEGCRFRPRCSTNDLASSTSTDAVTCSAVP